MLSKWSAIPPTDNSYDIGSSCANRNRFMYSVSQDYELFNIIYDRIKNTKHDLFQWSSTVYCKKCGNGIVIRDNTIFHIDIFGGATYQRISIYDSRSIELVDTIFSGSC